MPLARASHRCAQSTSTTENNRPLRYRAHVDHRRRRPRLPDPGSPRCRQRVGHRRKSLRRKRQCHSCQERMALPLLLHDFTATVANSPANRRPSNPHRVASGSVLSVRAQPQSSPVRGSVGSLTVIVPRWVDLQQGNHSRLARGQVGQFGFASQRVRQIGYVPVPAISLARAVSRSSVSSAMGAGRRLTARGSTRSGRLATRCA